MASELPRADPAPRAVARALRRALPLLFSGRLLGALLLWLSGSILVWIAIGAIAYTPASDALAGALGGTLGDRIMASLVVMAVIGVGTIVTALVAISIFSMPIVVRLAAARHFPALERRAGGTWHGSLRNLLVALGVFIPLWLASSALLAVPPAYVAVSWLLTGWLNQRLFRYDALAEHADRAELAALPRVLRTRLMLLGVILAPLALVPIVNLLLPLLAALAFACLCLDGLARARKAAS